MTLYEAILHCREKAKGCDACAEDHAQLAAWLTELKEMRDAQIPRVLPTNETWPEDEVIWLEEHNDIIPAMFMGLEFKTMFGRSSNYVKLAVMGLSNYTRDVANYGKRWRCWTHKPSKEQREAVKWNA